MSAQKFSVLVPEKIDETKLIYSSVPENDYPVYSAVGVYNTGDRVILTAGYHMVYESITDNNTNNFPATSFLNWVEVSPTNRYKPFDESGGTVLEEPSGFVQFEISNVEANSIGLLGVNTTTVRIEVVNTNNVTIYDQSYMFKDKAIINDWYDYFTARPIPQTELIVFSIPTIKTGKYRVTLQQTSGSVRLGTFVIGINTELGLTKLNPTVGIKNFGSTQVDQFGRRTYVRRGFAKRVNASVIVDGTRLDQINSLLAELRDSPALYIGAKDLYESLTVYGSYRDYSIVIEYSDRALCNLDIEGVV